LPPESQHLDDTAVVTRKGIEMEIGKPARAYGRVLTTATEAGGCYCKSNFEVIIKKLRRLALRQKIGTKVVVVHGLLRRWHRASLACAAYRRACVPLRAHS
jgi:hypothetical protein